MMTELREIMMFMIKAASTSPDTQLYQSVVQFHGCVDSLTDYLKLMNADIITTT